MSSFIIFIFIFIFNVQYSMFFIRLMFSPSLTSVTVNVLRSHLWVWARVNIVAWAVQFHWYFLLRCSRDFILTVRTRTISIHSCMRALLLQSMKLFLIQYKFVKLLRANDCNQIIILNYCLSWARAGSENHQQLLGWKKQNQLVKNVIHQILKSLHGRQHHGEFHCQQGNNSSRETKHNHSTTLSADAYFTRFSQLLFSFNLCYSFVSR